MVHYWSQFVPTKSGKIPSQCELQLPRTASVFSSFSFKLPFVQHWRSDHKQHQLKENKTDIIRHRHSSCMTESVFLSKYKAVINRKFKVTWFKVRLIEIFSSKWRGKFSINVALIQEFQAVASNHFNSFYRLRYNIKLLISQCC